MESDYRSVGNWRQKQAVWEPCFKLLVGAGQLLQFRLIGALDDSSLAGELEMQPIDEEVVEMAVAAWRDAGEFLGSGGPDEEFVGATAGAGRQRHDVWVDDTVAIDASGELGERQFLLDLAGVAVLLDAIGIECDDGHGSRDGGVAAVPPCV